MEFFTKVVLLVALSMIGVNAEEAPVEKDVVAGDKATSGEPRFLDDLLTAMEGTVGKVVSQVQTVHGVNGATKIVKTEITETYSSPVVPGLRFKRDLFGTLEGLMDNVENKVDLVKDRVAGKITDAVNIGYDVHNRIKGKLGERLRQY